MAVKYAEETDTIVEWVPVPCGCQEGHLHNQMNVLFPHLLVAYENGFKIVSTKCPHGLKPGDLVLEEGPGYQVVATSVAPFI